jgi:hypothetical protein
MFFVHSSYAQPQNTGASPYLDSEHSYRVNIGLVANTQEWIVTDKGLNTYNLTSTPQPWATITPALIDASYESIRIFFDRTVFSVGTWYLQFRETDGAHTCVSAREFPINVVENTFYLILANDITNTCNSQSNLVHTYEEVDGPADVYSTEVTYSVTMNKNDDFDPSSWSFDAKFSQSVVSFSATTTDGTLTTSVITPGTDYRINLTTSIANLSSVTVSLTVSYSNPVLADLIRNLTVSNGQAIVAAPPAPDALTNDNITVYPIASPGDRLQAITILAIPATQNILAGAGETATSATNPLQNSTHKYTVYMGSMANNYGNVGTGWRIVDANTLAPLTLGTDYTLVSNPSATNDTATIRYNMAPGNYILYYTEFGDNGCSAMRQFPFTLGEPFDVDIAEIGDHCAAIDGDILPGLAASTTTVVYTVTLNTASYGSDWSFDFTLGSVLALGDADLDVSSITVVGGTYTGSNYTGSVSVENSILNPVDEVTINVVYNGLYVTAHTITATLSNITGSFNEADDGTGNSTEHIIYSMPQATVLAGVD